MPYRILTVALVLLAGCYDFSVAPLGGLMEAKEEEAMRAVEQLAPGIPEVMKKSRQLHYGYAPRTSPSDDHSTFVHEFVQGTPALPKNIDWIPQPSIDNDSVKRLDVYLRDHHIRISPRGTLRRYSHESGGKSVVIEAWEVPEGRFLLTEVMIIQP